MDKRLLAASLGETGASAHHTGWMDAHVRVAGGYPHVAVRCGESGLSEGWTPGVWESHMVELAAYAATLAHALAATGKPPSQLAVDAVGHAARDGQPRVVELRVFGEVSGLDEAGLQAAAVDALRGRGLSGGAWLDENTRVVARLLGELSQAEHVQARWPVGRAPDPTPSPTQGAAGLRQPRFVAAQLGQTLLGQAPRAGAGWVVRRPKLIGTRLWEAAKAVAAWLWEPARGVGAWLGEVAQAAVAWLVRRPMLIGVWLLRWPMVSGTWLLRGAQAVGAGLVRGPKAVGGWVTAVRAGAAEQQRRMTARWSRGPWSPSATSTTRVAPPSPPLVSTTPAGRHSRAKLLLGRGLLVASLGVLLAVGVWSGTFGELRNQFLSPPTPAPRPRVALAPGIQLTRAPGLPANVQPPSIAQATAAPAPAAAEATSVSVLPTAQPTGAPVLAAGQATGVAALPTANPSGASVFADAQTTALPSPQTTTLPSPQVTTLSSTPTALAGTQPAGASTQATSSTSAIASSSPAVAPLLDFSPQASPRPAWPDDPLSTGWFAIDGYHLATRQAHQFVALGVLSGRRLRDVVVTATFRKTGGPAGGGYGIIVRDQGPGLRAGANQPGAFYVLEVGDRGEAGLWRRDGDQWIDLLPWTPTPAVRPQDAENTVSARAVGPALTLSVNGAEVATRSDATLTDGEVGVFLGGDGNQALISRLVIQPLD